MLAALMPAYADAAFLLGEPYGKMGALAPTGHAAVYLTNVCASTPTHLRGCKPGEGGVVISRYHSVAGYDWLAIPLLGYLYAVDSPADIPAAADAETVTALRDAYRRTHLLSLIPNTAEGMAPPGSWIQLVGSVYDRKLYGFQIETTPEQDAAFILHYNKQKNKDHYSLLFANCADFARDVLNFYAPQAVRRNFFTDAGITTPKQVARSLHHYARKHPVLELSSFVILQVPGSSPRSKRVAGVAEGLLKSKKYIVPLAFISPITVGSIAVLYVIEGRFNLKNNTSVFDIEHAVHPLNAEVRAFPPDIVQSSSLRSTDKE